VSQRPEKFRLEELQLAAGFLHIRILLYSSFKARGHFHQGSLVMI
jgi:hypothetical protein